MQDAPALDRPRRGRLPRRRDRQAAEGPGAPRRPAGHRGLRTAAERGGGQARADQLAQRADTQGAGAHPRGGRRPPARGRGLPAEREVAAVPRAPRPGVRLRAAPRALGRGAAAEGDRGDHIAAGRRVGALEPRLRPAGDPLRRRERALGRARAAHAPGPGVPLPGRRDRAGRRPGGERATTGRARPLQHPMQWDASPTGGFTTGDARRRWTRTTNVEAQRDDPRSMLSLVRDLHAAEAAGRSSSCSTPAPGCSPTAAASTPLPSTRPREPLPAAPGPRHGAGDRAGARRGGRARTSFGAVTAGLSRTERGRNPAKWPTSSWRT